MKTITTLMALTAFLAVGTLLTIGIGRFPTPSHRFTGMGDLPGGFFNSVPAAVSADGTIVVGHSNSAAGTEAFRWTRTGGIASLGFPQALAISADGAVVIGYRHINNQAEPVRWTRGGGTVGLGMLAGYRCGDATGVSANGSIIVGDFSDGPDSARDHDAAFRWTQQDGIADLKHLPPGFHDAEAIALSADGAVVVGAIQDELGYREAYCLCADTGVVRLGVLPGDTSSVARGVSADGSVVVGNSHSWGDSQAFRWTKETGMVGLEKLPGSRNSTARGVSADGSIIVGQYDGESGYEAFIWDADHGLRNVRQVLESQFGLGANLHGWKLRAATAVSADGSVVVGYGMNPDGNKEAWIARLSEAHRLVALAAASRVPASAYSQR